MFFRNGIRNVANASILVEKLGDAVDAKNARVEKYVRSGRTRTAAVLLRQVLFGFVALVDIGILSGVYWLARY